MNVAFVVLVLPDPSVAVKVTKTVPVIPQESAMTAVS